MHEPAHEAEDAQRHGLPDPASHRTGWSARRIDGVWCVGMTGNLDTVHDAVVRVNRHGSEEEAADIARWIARTYSDALLKERGPASDTDTDESEDAIDVTTR